MWFRKRWLASTFLTFCGWKAVLAVFCVLSLTFFNAYFCEGLAASCARKTTAKPPSRRTKKKGRMKRVINGVWVVWDDG